MHHIVHMVRRSRPDWDAVRRRLAEAIAAVRGGEGFTTSDLPWLAEKTGVERTLLGKFLHLYAQRRTNSLHMRNVEKICVALGVSTNWLLFGVPSQERGIWPAPVPVDPESLRSQTPVEVLLKAAESLVQIQDRTVQIALGRAALIGLLEMAGSTKVPLPAACYSALVWFEESRNVA